MSAQGEPTPPYVPEEWDLLDSTLQPEQLDRDLFRSRALLTPRGARGTFGGQLIGLALQAATDTVSDPDKVVNSLHSNFLLAGDSSKPIYFKVERVRDGKAFATRHVTAVQNGQPVYVATVSFHQKEKGGVRHAMPMPKGIMGPEEATNEIEVLGRMIASTKSEQLKENLLRKMSKESPILIRYAVPPVELKGSTKPAYAWLKSSNLGDAPMQKHRAVAALASDFFLAWSALFPHGDAVRNNLTMMVSLDHSIYFHNDFKADDWFLYEVHSSWADHNRALVRGRIFSRSGVLGMTVVQEVLVRTKAGVESVAKL